MDTFLTLSVEPDRVSDTGMQLVRKLIADKYGVDLPADFSPAWSVAKGELRGNITTRIKILLKKQHGVKVDATTLSELGNIAKRHTVAAEKFVFDFTACLDWQAGNFEDRSTCYWRERAGARRMLAEHGSLAIRFYEPARCECACHNCWCAGGHADCRCVCHTPWQFIWCPECKVTTFGTAFCPHCDTRGIVFYVPQPLCDGCADNHARCWCVCHLHETERDCCGEFHRKPAPLVGIGRAWIVFPRGREWKDNDLYRLDPDADIDACAVYNAYGVSLTMAAEVVSQYFGGLPYKEAKMFNNNTTEGTLYVNNSKCIVVGKDAGKIGCVSLLWRERKPYLCDECGDDLYEDETLSFGDNTYCESCYSDNVSRCYECRDKSRRADLIELDGDLYCDRCASRLFARCDGCYEYIPPDDTVSFNNRRLCEACAAAVAACPHSTYDEST